MCAHSWNNYVAYNCSTHVRTLSKFERQTYFSIFNFVFFFDIHLVSYLILLDLYIHEVLLVYSLFSMVLLSFLQLRTKIRASHYLVNIMEEMQFVSSNIKKAFEQCSCM